jgi:hypothetical protein
MCVTILMELKVWKMKTKTCLLQNMQFL